MEFVSFIESRRNKYGCKDRWAIFRCPVCGAEVERAYQFGMDVSACSKKCAGKLKKEKNSKSKESGKVRKKPRYIDRNNLEVPEECKGCGYWGQDGCSFIFRRGYSRTGFLKGRTCREAGIYTTKKPKQMYKEYF